jgi:hypothetical protein
VVCTECICTHVGSGLLGWSLGGHGGRMRCVMCRSSLPGMGKPGLVVAQVQGSPARNVYVPVWVMVSWGRRGRHVQEQCVAHPCVVWENPPMVVVRVQGPPVLPNSSQASFFCRLGTQYSFQTFAHPSWSRISPRCL